MAGRPRNQRNNANNDVIQAFINAIQGLAQGNQNPPPGNATSRIIKQFRKYAPPKFNGRSGPLALEEWLMELERIFEHIECEDVHRVSCAVFQLTEDAGQWWKSHHTGMTEEERQNLTWERFKELAMEKYFPRSFRNQKQTEFLALKQGTMSVTDYEQKFIQLARYATRLAATEADKVEYFLKGLRSGIRGILAMQETNNYGQAVRRALEVEAALEDDKVTTRNDNHQEKRKWDGRSEENGDFANKRERNYPRSASSAQVEKPVCSQCNKHHFGKCFKGTGVCYNCHEPGHYANNCTKSGRNDPKKGGNARLFSFTQQEAGERNGNKTGMLSISGISILVLLIQVHRILSIVYLELDKKICEMVEVENLAPSMLAFPQGNFKNGHDG